MLRTNFKNSMVNNPVKFFNTDVYNKARMFLFAHASTHCFLHNTYCRLSPTFQKIPYVLFLKEAIISRTINVSNPDNWPGGKNSPYSVLGT